MTEFVVLRFREPSSDSVEWIIVDDSGACLSEPRYGGLAAVSEAAAGNKVIVLVPALSVLRMDTDVPIRSISKLLKALPYAVEEQLAEDVELLHFAVGQRHKDGRLPVAVVQRSKMDAWKHRIAGAELNLECLYSDGDALGDIPGTTVLLVEPDRVTLCDMDGSVAIADRSGLDPLIDLWLAGRRSADDDGTAAPVNLLVYTTPDAQENLDSFLTDVHPRVDTLDVKLLPDGALPRMASQIVVNQGINLLQGDYAKQSNLGLYWPAWRAVAILLVCLTGAVFGVKVLEIVDLNRQATALDTAIEQAFRYSFPDIGQIRDPRAQLQSKLRELGNDASVGNEDRFLDTLQTIAAAVSESTDVNTKLETINYRGGVMELRVRAPDVETLDTIQKAIVKDSDLTAEIQSANPEGDQVLGRLQIKSPGA